MRDIRVAERELSAKIARVARWERQHSVSDNNFSSEFLDESYLIDGEVDFK
ncbi:MAG: hypothetical protein WCI04_04190 [archaeon]